MNILDLLKEIEYNEFKGNDKTLVNHITNDSRKARAGSIFVAIKGLVADGHGFIADAINNGASAILCEYIPDDLIDKSNYIVVKNSRKSMAQVASVIYDYPSEKLGVVGVTGTNGKTSTTYLLKAICDYAKKKSGIIGTMGVIINDEKIKVDNTTPESSDVQKIMANMLEENIDLCFMEVSSHALELNRVDNIAFDIGIFTNLTRDHLDYHKTMENYYLAKKKLFYMTSVNNIVNIDDPYGRRLYEELKKDNINVLSYGIDDVADIQAHNLHTSLKGTEFDLKISGIVKKVKVRTPGRFSVLNTLAVIGAAYCLNIELDDIIEALGTYNGVKGRFELLETKLNCTIILDFAHTPDGLEKVMETIDEFAKGRKIVLFGAGGERDISRRAQMGEIAGKYCDLSILTSDNPRYENPYDICVEISEGVKKYNGEYKIIVDRDKAVEYAISNFKDEDVILLAGKSTEPYQDVGYEKIPYDEATIAKKAIKEAEKKLGL